MVPAALRIQKAKELLQGNIEKGAKKTVEEIYQGSTNNIDYTNPDAAIEQLQRDAQVIRNTPYSGQTGAALADNLDRRAEQLALGGQDQKIANKTLIDNITAGVDYSNADIDGLLGAGIIDGQTAKRAKELIQDKNLPATSIAKLYVNNSVAEYSNNLAGDTGLVFKVEGSQVIMEGTSKLTGLSKEQLKGVAKTLNFQMNQLAIDVYNSRPASESDEKEKMPSLSVS